MKSEKEIKEFIDGCDALTYNELRTFICGYKTGNKPPLVNDMWQYVLQTKDWAKLRNHLSKKRTHNVGLNFPEFKKIYDQDERFQKYGRFKIARLLSTHYNKNIGKTVITEYLQRIRGRKYEAYS